MLKVMLVDNEAVIRKGLAHCIDWDSLSCQVVAYASDGIEALEKIRQEQPDIVISDIRMPGMDGLELAKVLSEQYPQIKTVILTGFPDFEYARRAITYRVVDFVLKPTDVDQLTAAITKACQQIAEERNLSNLKRALADTSEQNLLLQRTMLLRDMIYRLDMSHSFIISRMEQLHLNLSSFYVLRMAVSSPSHETESGKPAAYLLEAQEILADCLSAYPVYFVPRSAFVAHAVVCVPERKSLMAHCLETVTIVGSMPRFTLSIGISRHHTDPFQIPVAADEAGQAQQYADYFADQSVIEFEKMPSITQDILQQIMADLKLLKSAIEHQNLEATRGIFHKLFQYVRDSMVPMEELRTICTYIYNFCVNLLFQYNSADCPELFTLSQLLEERSVDEIERNMADFIERILIYTIENSTNLDSLILTVKNFIEQHYTEDISLESLSALVHLSPSYLSKLFKKSLGVNISVYLQNIRIEKAKTLIRTTSLKTYEIAERVGIHDPVYFCRIFKKVTGVKTKDYRAHEDGTL